MCVDDYAQMAIVAKKTGEASLQSEKYGEDLPPQCPPAGAQTTALDNVYRLVPCENPVAEHFLSFRAMGTDKPDHLVISDCDWASCSLRDSVEELLKLKGLRRRNPFVATLGIPANSGRHLTHKSHVHFWRFHNFEIASHVTACVAHNR